MAEIVPKDEIEPSVTPLILIVLKLLKTMSDFNASCLIMEISAWVSTKKIHFFAAMSQNSDTKSEKLRFRLYIVDDFDCCPDFVAFDSFPVRLGTGHRSFPDNT